MKAHYVPRLYLKNFADKNKRINVLSKINNELRENVLIDKLSCQKDYYKITFNHPNISDNLIENIFANGIEPEFNNLIKNTKSLVNVLNYNNEYIKNKKYKYEIIEHLVIQHFRSKSFKESFAGYGIKINDSYKEKMKLIEDVFGENIARFNLSNDEINQILLSMMGGDDLLDIVNIIYTYKVMIIINCSSIDFLTSDNPVNIYSYLYDIDNIIYLPITPQIAFICFSDFDNKFDDNIYYKKIYSDEFIDKLNLNQLRLSYNEIYTCDKNYLSAIQYQNKDIIKNTNFKNRIRAYLS